MALSTLYPGTTKAKNWDAAYPPPPTSLANHDLPLLLQQLDQFWDLAPEPVLAQIRNVLAESDQPLAREAAARALGHMADPGAMQVLIKGLGDPVEMAGRGILASVRSSVSGLVEQERHKVPHRKANEHHRKHQKGDVQQFAVLMVGINRHFLNGLRLLEGFFPFWIHVTILPLR